MSHTHFVTESHATGDEIFQLVKAIDPILVGHTKPQIIIACLSIALIEQEPELSVKELQDGIKGASEWMCVFLSTTEAAKLARGGIIESIN